jgi:HAD superfamily hydrolase (TIGR01509 family)
LGRLIIYDFDGTLVDSERLVAKVCLQAIHGLGLTDWTMDRYVEAFVGMPGHVGWGRVQEALGRDFPCDFNASVDKQIDAIFAEELETLPGVRGAVEGISGPRCIASSTILPHLRHNVKRTGLDDLFGPHVFSASQVEKPKPHPDVYFFAAREMGHEPDDCLVVEDSVPGVTAAVRAGMRVVGYTGSAHDSALMRARLHEAGATTHIAHMDELPATIARLRS